MLLFYLANGILAANKVLNIQESIQLRLITLFVRLDNSIEFDCFVSLDSVFIEFHE